MSVSGKPQLHSLQLVRALAATAVIICHMRLQGTTFGQSGVDLFFVLSGYVIAMVTQGGPGPRKFILDRLTRLVPLYWVVTIALYVILLVKPDYAHSAMADPVWLTKSLLFIPFFKMPGLLQPLLGLGWTLNYEMLFYALVGLVLCWRRRNVMLPVTGLLLLAYGMGSILPPDGVLGTFLFRGQIFEFALGMLAFHLQSRPSFQRVPVGLAVLVVPAALGVMAWTELDSPQWEMLWEAHVLPNWTWVGTGVPAMFVVLAMRRLEPWIARGGMLTRVGVLLGDASYAIYLTHYFTIQAFRQLLLLLGPALDPSVWWVQMLTFALVLAVGTACYLLLDKPLVRLSRNITEKKLYKTVHSR